MSDLQPWGRPGGDKGRVNYDTINGGPEIESINGATKKGDSGFHDPYQKPPAGFEDWHQVGQSNMDTINEAAERQKALEGAGFKYDSSNGTWVGPSGRTTTLFGNDPGPEGGVDYHWDRQGAGSERGQIEGQYGDDPRRQGDDDKGTEMPSGLSSFLEKWTIWGRILKHFGR
jgi:hypothetical protein